MVADSSSEEVDFSIYLILPATLWPRDRLSLNRNEYQESSWGGEGRPAPYVSRLYRENMRPRRLTTLWAFTAYYRDSFTFYIFGRICSLRLQGQEVPSKCTHTKLHGVTCQKTIICRFTAVRSSRNSIWGTRMAGAVWRIPLPVRKRDFCFSRRPEQLCALPSLLPYAFQWLSLS
jgi:hypothetical protein